MHTRFEIWKALKKVGTKKTERGRMQGREMYLVWKFGNVAILTNSDAVSPAVLSLVSNFR